MPPPEASSKSRIISVEEQWRGWLAVIARTREVRRQVNAYQELVALLDFLNRWTVMPPDENAAARFESLRGAGCRIGSMDLKITCVALVHDALVLSANLVDFRKVSELRVENWLD